MADKIKRVCAECERVAGPVPVEPGEVRSHGYCRRHFIACHSDYPELISYGNSAPDSVFSPDTSARHEDASRVVDSLLAQTS